MSSTNNNSKNNLPRLEDVGQAILELQEMAIIKAQPTSEDEYDQVTPIVASLRDHLIDHLVRVKAMSKQLLAEIKSSSGNTNNSNNSSSTSSTMNAIAANHEYSNAVTDLLKAIRELFPDPLEFSSGLVRSSRLWWRKFGTRLQPTNVSDHECILEVSGQSSSNVKTTQDGKREGNNSNSDSNEDSDDDDDIVTKFDNHDEISNQWWEAVIHTISGHSSLTECNPHSSSTTNTAGDNNINENNSRLATVSQDTIVVSAGASFYLYCFGPAITSKGETAAGIVMKRIVSMMTSLSTQNASAIVRSVARLLIKFLLILVEKKNRLSSSSTTNKTANSSSAEIALIEHEGSLALHRFFTILSQITKYLEHNNDSNQRSRSSPSTPPESFLLPLLGVRELLSSQELLTAMYNSDFTNWIRKLVMCPSNYFSPSHFAHHLSGTEFGGSSSSFSSASLSYVVDLDIYLSSLIFASLRSSKLSLSSSVSEHSERTVCISSNYFLHLIAVELSQHHVNRDHHTVSASSSTMNKNTTNSTSTTHSLDDKLDISPSQLQLLRIALLHDGIPFPPPRPTEAHGIYRNFCPHCLHVCMEIRRVCSVGTNGLVLSLAEEDVAPWANMLWRDGPNAFTGSATSFRRDSPSRRTMMPKEKNEQDETDTSAEFNVSPELRSALVLKQHPQQASTISQADIPRLYSPIQRAAAVFRLALIEGGTISSSSSSSSGSHQQHQPQSCSSSGNDVGRVPVVVWASAAEGLLEILEQDISLIEYRHQNQNHSSSSSALDPATYIAVASAATISTLACLLKFPCDRALMRLNRVLKCRTKRGFKNREEREILFKLIDEINPATHHQRPRTSELFDNVNPLIFAEWEKIFARCCEEALRAPSVSMQRLMMAGDFLFSSSTLPSPAKNSNQNKNSDQRKKEIPKPTRESSLSEKEGNRVIVWLDSTMTTTLLFGVDPSTTESNMNFENAKGSDSAPTSATGSRRPSEFSTVSTNAGFDDEELERDRRIAEKRRLKIEKREQKAKEKEEKKKEKQRVKLLAKKKKVAAAKKAGKPIDDLSLSSSSSSDSSSEEEEETGSDEDDGENLRNRPQQQWIPIWVSLLPDGTASSVGREREVAASSKYHGCCGIVCADTSLNCPLRPNDLVFFTPACPEDVQINTQPDVLFPRVVLRAWRLVGGASALVPNIAIRRLSGAKKSFRLTLTSGEEGYTPLQLVAGACDDDPAIIHWPLAQWWGLLRELGRREEVRNQQQLIQRSARNNTVNSPSSTSASKSTSASGTSIFQTFGPDFIHSAAKGSLRSFWCSLRDITIPVLSSSRKMHPSCLYWKVDQKKMGIESSSLMNSTSSCVWPPPYASLGATFGVSTTSNNNNSFELDSWGSTVSLEINDMFLEAAEA